MMVTIAGVNEKRNLLNHQRCKTSSSTTSEGKRAKQEPCCIYRTITTWLSSLPHYPFSGFNQVSPPNFDPHQSSLDKTEMLHHKLLFSANLNPVSNGDEGSFS